MRAVAWCLSLLCGIGLLLQVAAAPTVDRANAGAAHRRREVPGRALARDLEQGRGVELEHAVVAGNLVLRRVAGVNALFKCTNCTFEGTLDASDVVFNRTVNLSGSKFAGPVDFGGTTFREAALFGTSPALFGRGSTKSEFLGRTDFSFSLFQGSTSFDGAWFVGMTEFSDAHFGGNVDFGATRFFRRAGFGKDEFGGRTDFSQAEFFKGAVFDEAQLLGDACGVKKFDSAGRQCS
jgi:Pentapeptide repeats (9 copies)